MMKNKKGKWQWNRSENKRGAGNRTEDQSL